MNDDLAVPSIETGDRSASPRSASGKFSDPMWTAKGERRATVPLTRLATLWFNTGTLCNIACTNCYIESSPKNDALVYLDRTEVRGFLDAAVARHPRPTEIGFTGGEPFMNPDILGMIEDSLAAGFHVLVLTNAMKPMRNRASGLLDLHRRHPGRLTLRVSLDHYQQTQHEMIRGAGTWGPAIGGLRWLASNGFDVAIATRLVWQESDQALRAGFARLASDVGLAIDVQDPARLVLFPEMQADADVPEITVSCWGILKKSPDSVMCSSSRMVVKRKGEAAPAVVACTLLPFSPEFELGRSLSAATRPVSLNHRHCAKFCVLGGASCSPAH